MSLRIDRADPADMKTEDRLDEIARVCARGILRLHGRVRAGSSPPQNLEDSQRHALNCPHLLAMMVLPVNGER